MPSAYPLVFALGSLAGMLWLLLVDPARRKPVGPSREAPTPAARFDAGLSALAGGLLGARLGFVLAHWGYFASRPVEALVFRQGGLSWAAGAVGALAGLGAYAGLTRRPLWTLADGLAFPAALLVVAAWGGCWLDGCAYGRPASAGLLTPVGFDYFGGRIARWPTQAVGLLLGLTALLGILALSSRVLRPGMLACAALATTAAAALGLSFTRGDPAVLLFGARLDALAAGALLLLALSGLAWRARSA